MDTLDGQKALKAFSDGVDALAGEIARAVLSRSGSIEVGAGRGSMSVKFYATARFDNWQSGAFAKLSELFRQYYYHGMPKDDTGRDAGDAIIAALRRAFDAAGEPNHAIKTESRFGYTIDITVTRQYRQGLFARVG
jgi:hypothetical protein